MNLSNNSSGAMGPGLPPSFGESFKILQGIGGAVGLLECLFNFIILIGIKRLSHSRASGYVIQITAVAVNDILNGFALFAASIIDVINQTTITLCAAVINFSTTFSTITILNIMFICLQKFVYVSTMAKTTSFWRKVHTYGLVFGNVVSGLVILAVSQTTLSYLQERPGLPICNPLAVFKPTYVQDVQTAFFYLIIIAIAVSNVSAFATLWKLMAKPRVGPPPKSESGIGSSDNPSSNKAPTNVAEMTHKRNKRGAITFVLIVAAYDVTLLNSFTGSVMQLAGVQVTPVHFQAIYIINSMNAIFNPIIILLRTKDLGNIFSKDLAHLRHLLLRCIR